MKEVLFPDGSTQINTGDDGFIIEGDTAMLRYQLLSCISALDLYLRTGMHVRRGYTQQAIDFVAHHAGKTYPRSRRGKKMAIEDAIKMVRQIEMSAVVLESDNEVQS